MKTYNTTIVGGGASGMLAGIYLDDDSSILLEKNNSLGKKILLTGGGRCNITNASSLKEYMDSYYNSGKYYRNAFSNFFNKDIIKLLEDNGCKTKVEDDKRVFPETDNSKTVVNTLIRILENKKTKIKVNANVNNIERLDNGLFEISYNNNQLIKTKNIILATGGNSYPQTGSTGDGKKFAVSLGHEKTKNRSGLAPIKIKEEWIKKLQGIAINTNLEIKADKKSIAKDSGSVLFTHKGLSGFIILDNSMIIEEYLRKNMDVTINLDLAGSYSYEELDKILQNDFNKKPNQELKNYLHKYLPKNMTTIFLEQLNISPKKILNQLTKKERAILRDNLKRTSLTVVSILEGESITTNSGIMQKEIDPNTFESKIVPNLYIVGELVEGCGICGGYNLQKAFSTGALAAATINKRLNE